MPASVAEPLEQRPRRRRVGRRRDVVRHRCPQRHRLDPRFAARVVQHADDAGGAFVARADEAEGADEVGVGGGAGDPHPARVRHVAEQRAEGDDHRAAGLVGDRHHRAAVGLPANVGLDAAQHHEVAAAERGRVVVVRGPGDRAGDAVDELDLRPARLVVDVLVGVDCRRSAGRATSGRASRRRRWRRRRRRSSLRTRRRATDREARVSAPTRVRCPSRQLKGPSPAIEPASASEGLIRRRLLDAGCEVSGVRRRGGAGLDGGAVALGVTGDASDGHVDAEPGGGALLFGLATPEAVLAVLAGPLAARREHGAGVADGAGLGLADGAGLGPLTGGGEEEVVLASACGRARSR